MAVMDYRTRDGLADYGFSIELQSDTGWRVHIIFQPFPQRHDDSLQLSNQAINENGRRYVDWSGKLDRLGDAKAVAAGLSWPSVTSAPKNNEGSPLLTQIVSPPVGQVPDTRTVVPPSRTSSLRQNR